MNQFFQIRFQLDGAAMTAVAEKHAIVATRAKTNAGCTVDAVKSFGFLEDDSSLVPTSQLQ